MRFCRLILRVDALQTGALQSLVENVGSQGCIPYILIFLSFLSWLSKDGVLFKPKHPEAHFVTTALGLGFIVDRLN